MPCTTQGNTQVLPTYIAKAKSVSLVTLSVFIHVVYFVLHSYISFSYDLTCH